MDSVVTELRREGFRIRKIDVRTHQGKAEDYRIRRVPTFVYLRDGEEVRRASGNMAAQTLRNLWREPLF